MSELVDLASRIQQVPAPTFAEGERARLVAELLESFGLIPTRVSHACGGPASTIPDQTATNVYLRVPGADPTAPALLVSAHTDTVFPLTTDLTLTRDAETGRLAGPGIGDNSLAVAALVMLARRTAAAAPSLPCDVWFVANAGEEGLGDLAGIRAAIDHIRSHHGPGIGAGIVLEGMLLGGIYHAGIGVRRYRLIAEGPGGHSWGDFGRESAVHALARAITDVLEVSVPRKPRTTINLGTISGGTSINTIAAHAEAELDLRSETQHGVAALEASVLSVLDRWRGTDEDGVRIRHLLVGSRPAGSIPREHPLVQAASETLVGLGIEPVIKAGSTDANALFAANVPAVCVGITTGRGAHTLDEYIDTAPAAQGLEQVERLVPRAAAIAATVSTGGTS
jgi:acetylornithine deacetylase/succinyl-diaminopimelate desuccinylase-like protein